MENLIHLYFDDIINKYKMTLQIINDYKFLLLNDNIIVEIYWGQHFQDFQMCFESQKDHRRLSIVQIMEKKDLFGKELFNDLEFADFNSLESELDKNLFMLSIALKKDCSDILSGDFSIMESSS